MTEVKTVTGIKVFCYDKPNTKAVREAEEKKAYLAKQERAYQDRLKYWNFN